MAKKFYTAGVCIPEQNYMVDVSGRVDTIIADYIDEGKYFTVNRARQYGKSTMFFWRIGSGRFQSNFRLMIWASGLQACAAILIKRSF